MKLQVEKTDLSWLQKNGFVSLEQVSVLWEQLCQKCVPIHDTTVGNSTSVQLEIPPVEGLYLGERKTNDICIAYALNNGDKLAQTLQKRLSRKKKRVSLAVGCSGVFDPREAEKAIASSYALVVVLTADCLKKVEVVFALHVAKFYYEHPSLVILVHDAESCFFPGYDEQPESVKEFFSEKAVTFLSCYPEDGVEEIAKKFDEEVKVLESIVGNYQEKPTDALYQILAKNENRKHLSVLEIRKRMSPFMSKEQLDEFEAIADKNKDGTLDPEELQEVLIALKEKSSAKQTSDHGHDAPHEDLTTRVFLSHKRSTGQGIAGRLYEGLKTKYSVFIDSEAKFKIHNLRLIVESTDVFVFILSHGILLSKWCLEELKSAVANKKRVIIVRELSYKIPDELPAEWLEVEHILRKSPELIWIAEYNASCVKALCSFIGSPDTRYRKAQKLLQGTEHEVIESIIQKFQTDHVLDLNRSIAVPYALEDCVDAVLDVVIEEVPVDQIKSLHVNASSEEMLIELFLKLPNIQELTLSGSPTVITAKAIKSMVDQYPSLQKLTLEYCAMTGSICSYIADAEELQHLDIERTSLVTNDTVEKLIGCPSLESLKITLGDITGEVYQYLEKMPRLKEVHLPYSLKHKEETLRYQAEHSSVTVITEPLFVDVEEYGCWYAGAVVGFTSTHTIVHAYARAGDERQSPEISINHNSASSCLAKFKSKQEKYAEQRAYHGFNGDCSICELMHTQLEHVKFKNTPNLYFANDWFPQSPQGQQFFKELAERAAKGYLRKVAATVHSSLPPLKPETIGQYLFKEVDPNAISAMYLNDLGATQMVYWLKKLPNLKVLSGPGWSKLDTEVLNSLPASIEELEIRDELDQALAKALPSKLPKLQTLYMYNVPNNESIVTLCKEAGNKITSLSINESKIGTYELQQIAEANREVITLDVTMAPNLHATCIPILIKEFPKLKTLFVDPLIFKSPDFQSLKAARPNLIIDENAYVKDVYLSQFSKWYPAIQENHLRGPGGFKLYHVYGLGWASKWFDEEDLNDEKLITTLFTHTEEYGQLRACYDSDCAVCNVLTPLCEDIKFDGQPNPFMFASQYFATDEGKELLAKHLVQGPENKIVFDAVLPDRIKMWHVVEALAKQHPEKKFTVQVTDGSVDALKTLLSKPLPICGLEFHHREDLDSTIWKEIKQLQLTRLVLSFCPQLKDGWDNLSSLTKLEYLDISGCSQVTDQDLHGIVNCAKLAHLNVSFTQISDQTVALVAKHLTNLSSFKLRGVKITEKSIEYLTQGCIHMQVLDISLCTILSEKWKTFQATRPTVTVVDEAAFMDCFLEKYEWQPAVILSETPSKYLLHRYSYSDRNPIWYDKNSEQIAPFLSKKDNYGFQNESHVCKPCNFCDILHPLCKDLLFGWTNKKNYAFINEWYWDTEDGISKIDEICELIKTTGKLDGGMKTEKGLHIDTIFQKVVEKVGDAITEIVFSPTSVEMVDLMLSKTPNLQSVSLHGPFTDAHVAVVAHKNPMLKKLSFFLCDVTNDGLKMVAEQIHLLESFGIRHCKNITDKGIELVLLANQDIQEIELDFQHQITDHSITLLSTQPRLKSLKYFSRIGQKKISQEISQLKATKPKIAVTQGQLIVDCLFAGYSTGWLPGFVTGYDEIQGKLVVHITGEHSWQGAETILVKENETVEGFSHRDKYRYAMALRDCEMCHQLDAACRYFTFGENPLSWVSRQ